MLRASIHALAITSVALGFASLAWGQLYETRSGRATPRRAASVLFIQQVLGEGEDWLSYPVLDLSINTQFELDYQHFIGDGDSFNLVNTSDLTAALFFAPRLAIFTDITLDQINGPDPGQDSWLEDEGLFLSNLFLQYSNQIVTVGGGQFTPNFGIANALAPGVFGDDFVSDYSFDDQIGLFASINFGEDQVGQHIFSSSLFMTDTSFLSDSIITRRGQTSRSDGGPGNSGSLESFAISYDGIDVPIGDMPILQYQIGFISQARGEDSSARQYGFVGGAAITIPLDGDPYATVANRYQALQPLIEHAHFENWTGADDATADYLTLGINYIYGDWDFNVSGTRRWLDGVPGQGNTDDFLVQASIGYQLYGYQALEGNGQIAFGWSYREESDQDSHTFGIVLTLGWDMFNDFQLLRGW